jgi:heme iron utilization protein
VSVAAAEARALVAASTIATLATLSGDGAPWASLVAYAARAGDGAPILCVSDLAEHGRNLARDPRAGLVVAGPAPGLDRPRVTLAGRVERTAEAADRDAYRTLVAGAGAYVDFADFTLYVLRVERVRWVGGFGRMQTVEAADYARAAA